MQIQKINPTVMKEQPNGIGTDVNISKKPCSGCYTTSVFSKGMSGLAFGSAAALKTSFEKEIAEQPKVLEKLSKRFFSKSGSINMDLKLTPGKMAHIKRILIIASGSSKNAGEMAKDFIEHVTHLPVSVESASEYMCRKDIPINNKEDLGIFISQSGKTADTLRAIRQAHSAGIHTISITNTDKSLIADTANANINIDAGEENAVAATKTVTSTIYTLMAAGLKLAELQEQGDLNSVYINDLKQIPSRLKEMLKDTKGVREAAKVIAKADNIYYYAKGNNIGAVKEGALKLTETTGKRVIADSSSEALHGTFASIKPEDPVLQVVVGERWSDNRTISANNIREIAKKRNVQNPIIMRKSGDEDIEKTMQDFDSIYIDLPDMVDMYSQLFTTVRMQQITSEVTKKMGINPDNGGGFLTKYRSQVSM